MMFNNALTKVYNNVYFQEKQQFKLHTLNICGRGYHLNFQQYYT